MALFISIAILYKRGRWCANDVVESLTEVINAVHAKQEFVAFFCSHAYISDTLVFL